MGEDLGGKAHGNSVDALGQEQREFCWQHHRFLLPAVIGEFPFGGLGIEKDLQGEFRQARFDITGSRGTITGENIAPVSLGIHQQLLLPQLHQGIPDRSISVGMILHGLPDDVGYLVETAVIHLLHGMENPTLNGLQPVNHIGYGPLQDHIGGVIQEPLPVHPRQIGDPLLGHFRLVLLYRF